MQIQGVIYAGPPERDLVLLAELPEALQSVLKQANGFVAFRGGLHLRGACAAPEWHSLAHVWKGPLALSKLYASVAPEDIPFAQDCLGDQFLLRKDKVWKLLGETGEIQPLELNLSEFLNKATADPLNFLSLQPLAEFMKANPRLQPGQLLNIYPPLCTQEAGVAVSMKAIPALERLRFLADFARQLDRIPDGITMSFKLIL